MPWFDNRVVGSMVNIPLITMISGIAGEDIPVASLVSFDEQTLTYRVHRSGMPFPMGVALQAASAGASVQIHVTGATGMPSMSRDDSSSSALPVSQCPPGSLCELCLDAPAWFVRPAPWGGDMGVCMVCATQCDAGVAMIGDVPHEQVVDGVVPSEAAETRFSVWLREHPAPPPGEGITMTGYFHQEDVPSVDASED